MTDPNTGLPALPEGYFWRIASEGVQIRKSLPDTKWESYDPGYPYYGEPLIEGDYETRTVEDSVSQVVPRPWWNLFGTDRLVTREIKSRQGRFVNRSSAELTYRPDTAITHDNVESVVAEAYKRFEALSLFGDYPPKKLGQP